MHALLENYFNFIRRFIPSKPEETSIGLDIGAGDCKLVEIKKTGDAFELVNWTIDPVKNGDVQGTLRSVLEPLGALRKSIYTAVSGKGTLIRYIEMPRMSLGDLRNSFAIEADKYFPFAQDQIYTDCYILDPQGKGAQMSVMAAAAKKDIVDQRVQLLTDLGIQPDFIGINAVAVANGLHVLGFRDKEQTGSVVALFDMGESVSNLTILIDKLPRFTRDIFIGGRDYTKRISNALGVSFEEAEALKRQPEGRKEEVINACESAIMSMVQEIRLSFDYFATEKNKEVNHLLLTGGASMMENIAEIFKKTLDIPVDIWNPIAALKISPALSPEEAGRTALKLGVAVGLALYQYD